MEVLTIMIKISKWLNVWLLEVEYILMHGSIMYQDVCSSLLNFFPLNDLAFI